jgi:hypothetical protein
MDDEEREGGARQLAGQPCDRHLPFTTHSRVGAGSSCCSGQRHSKKHIEPASGHRVESLPQSHKGRASARGKVHRCRLPLKSWPAPVVGDFKRPLNLVGAG